MSRIFRGGWLSGWGRVSLVEEDGALHEQQRTDHVVIRDDLLAIVGNDIYSVPTKTTI